MAVMLFAVGEVGWPGLQVDFIGGPGKVAHDKGFVRVGLLMSVSRCPNSCIRSNRVLPTNPIRVPLFNLRGKDACTGRLLRRVWPSSRTSRIFDSLPLRSELG